MYKFCISFVFINMHTLHILSYTKCTRHYILSVTPHNYDPFPSLGWVPKAVIRNHLNKVYILDFFGTSALKPALKIDLRTRILTAYTTEYNTFLGFYLKSPTFQQTLGHTPPVVKKNQGVIWGKDYIVPMLYFNIIYPTPYVTHIYVYAYI